MYTADHGPEPTITLREGFFFLSLEAQGITIQSFPGILNQVREGQRERKKEVHKSYWRKRFLLNPSWCYALPQNNRTR